MRQQIWSHKSTSYKEAAEFDRKYYLAMTSTERLETMQLLREMLFKYGRHRRGKNGKGLRRTLRIIQQTQS